MNNKPTTFFRFGLIAKGVVYFMIGVFAIMTATNYGSQEASSKSVLKFIEDQPFGNVLLVLIGIGLAGYAAMRWYSVINGTEGQNTSKEDQAKDAGKRVGYAASAVTHSALTVYTFSLVISSLGSSGGGTSRQELIGKLLDQSWGQWVVGAIAIGLFIAAAYQIYKGLSGKFMDDVSGLGGKKREAYEKAGRIGLPSRGVIFGVIAYFLFRAALQGSSTGKAGSDSALTFLQNQAIWLAIVVAVGLAAYGVFMIIKAKYKAF
jgi:hypothetical protein